MIRKQTLQSCIYVFRGVHGLKPLWLWFTSVSAAMFSRHEAGTTTHSAGSAGNLWWKRKQLRPKVCPLPQFMS